MSRGQHLIFLCILWLLYSISFSRMFPEPWKIVAIDILIMVKVLTAYSQYFKQYFISVLVNSHYSKIGISTNSGFQHKYLDFNTTI